MSLDEIVNSVERSERTLTVFNPADAGTAEPDIVEALRTTLSDRNVEIRSETTESGRPRNSAVLEMDGIVLATIDIESLESLLETTDTDRLGFDTDDYDDVLRHLRETTFTSYDRGQMLEATREIEDRAFRVGHGALHAGFQTTDRLADQRERYEELVDRGLAVTVYATPGDDPVTVPGATVSTPETDEIATHWFVAFDGGGEPTQKSALLAEQRSDGFYGCWTYDPDVVDWILTHLRDRYGPDI